MGFDIIPRWIIKAMLPHQMTGHFPSLGDEDFSFMFYNPLSWPLKWLFYLFFLFSGRSPGPQSLVKFSSTSPFSNLFFFFFGWKLGRSWSDLPMKIQIILVGGLTNGIIPGRGQDYEAGGARIWAWGGDPGPQTLQRQRRTGGGVPLRRVTERAPYFIHQKLWGQLDFYGEECPLIGIFIKTQ